MEMSPRRERFRHRELAEKRANEQAGVSSIVALLVILSLFGYAGVLIGIIPFSNSEKDDDDDDDPEEWTDKNLRTPSGILTFVGVVGFFGTWICFDVLAAGNLVEATEKNVDPREALESIKFWKRVWPITTGIWVLLILAFFLTISIKMSSLMETSKPIIFIGGMGFVLSICHIFVARSTYQIVDDYAKELKGTLEVEVEAKAEEEE